jgi:DNA-binding transcriptional MerR regulator
MYIGTLSRAAQASPKAIRLYESLGLLTDVQRRGAYRIYAEHHVAQVRLIRRALALGFRLAELQPMLAGRGGEPDWEQVSELVRRKQADIAAEIVRLEQLHDELGLVLGGLRQCRAAQAGPGTRPCERPLQPAARHDCSEQDA